jgi:hypothetical protein
MVTLPTRENGFPALLLRPSAHPWRRTEGDGGSRGWVMEGYGVHATYK